MRKLLFISFFLLIALSITAQEKPDTLKTSDTTGIILLIDTSKQVQSDIDAIINYNAADSVVFDLTSNKMTLFNEAEVTYKDLKLNSGIIIINRQTQILDAEGLPFDSAGVTRFIQMPLMFQGKDKYEGSSLTYSFKTQRGTISKGYSDADVGYYFGDKIKKVTPEIIFIRDGIYTTSTDKTDPEYYFFSPKMKVMPGDKIVAQSVFLYIEGVPVFWVPFLVLPNRTGRSSGLIIPTYGTDATYGLYLSNFGYFWAINDFTDIAVSTTVFSKGRFDFKSRFRYAKKYKYQGTAEGGYSLIKTGEATDKDRAVSDQWILSLIHSQKINPTLSLDGNLSFVSGKSYYDNSTNNLPLLLRQNVVSNLTLSKYWEETPFSMTVNYYRDQSLQTGAVNERLPDIAFNVTETFPFRKSQLLSTDSKFYEFFSFSYRGNIRNDRIKTVVLNPDGSNGAESTNINSGFINNISLSYAPVSKYLNIRPYFAYTEIWYPKYITKSFNPLDSSVSVQENDAFKAVRYFQTGISFNTKFIGIFTPRIFGLTGIKHTLTPQISYNFRPDFSSSGWGYYGNYTDATGKPVKYSYYEQNLFGTAPAGESQSISFVLGNLFEGKSRIDDSTENKFQLININAGVNYNFAADSLQWSEISADFRTQIGSLLNIGGNMRFNLYDFDYTKGTRVNKFLWSEQNRIADLTGFNINVSSSFSLGLMKSSRDENKSPGDSLLGARRDSVNKSLSVFRQDFEDVEYNIPFTGGINFNYSVSRDNPAFPVKQSNVSTNIAFSPSPRWRFGLTASYDILNKQVSAPYITAYRDLNSWEINFNWYPIGQYRGFFFEVRIKAPQLRDLKVTKQTNSRGVYY